MNSLRFPKESCLLFTFKCFMNIERRFSKMAPRPTRFDDLMNQFDTTPELNHVLRDLQLTTMPSQITFEPELTLNVTTEAVAADEVPLILMCVDKEVKNSYIYINGFFLFKESFCFRS